MKNTTTSDFFSGYIERSRFGDLYALMVRYDTNWNLAETSDRIYFAISVDDREVADFKDELFKLLTRDQITRVQSMSLLQKIIQFFKPKKGNHCDNC